MVVGISRKLLVLQNPAYRPTHCFYSLNFISRASANPF
jgi:hypothetical protein